MISEDVVIEGRFSGPPDSANGGYACGVVAAALGPHVAAEVTLRSPPPLDRPLTLAEMDGGVELRDGQRPVASGRRAPRLDLDVPAPVTLEEAAEARLGSPYQRSHPYPSCFVCSPERAIDGLGVVCGPVAGREDELVAAPFETAKWMAGEAGAVREELVWSVLDCPSGIACMLDPEIGVSMLGRMTGEIRAPVTAGEDHVAIGWLIGRDGRKIQAGTAILDGAGDPLALARATWIELREQPALPGSRGARRPVGPGLPDRGARRRAAPLTPATRTDGLAPPSDPGSRVALPRGPSIVSSSAPVAPPRA